MLTSRKLDRLFPDTLTFREFKACRIGGTSYGVSIFSKDKYRPTFSIKMAEDPDLLSEEQDGFDVFQKYRMDIVKSIDTDKQFMFSYLRSNSVLDEEDCERINHKVTRQEKVTKMLDILSLKGPGAKEHFVKAVEFEHPRLYEKITGKKAHSSK